MSPEYYRSAVRSSVAKQAVRKLGRLRHSGDGRLESLGHDFDRGHRDYVEARCEWDGVAVTLVDTAGDRDAGDEIERRGIALAAQRIDTADVVVWVSEGAASDESVKVPVPDVEPPEAEEAAGGPGG